MYFIIFLISLNISANIQALTPGDLQKIQVTPEGRLIMYGYNLVNNTAHYYGPSGTIKKIARNNMSCANCHLEGGMKRYGNSWLDTHGLYPQFRQREGKVQSLIERINTCFQGNLLGDGFDKESDEMKAILLYFRWINKGRPVLQKDLDNRLISLKFLSRAASIPEGKKVYFKRCIKCHGIKGQGLLDKRKIAYKYPPLWGKNSFMLGTSMSRLSVLARFVKANMPYKKLGEKADLSVAEAWDVSSFILSHERPKWDRGSIFPDLKHKPFDFPFGPYADSFSVKQHRLGPFKPIINYWISKMPDLTDSIMGI